MMKVCLKHRYRLLCLAALALPAFALGAGALDKCQLQLTSDHIDYGKLSPAQLSAAPRVPNAKAFGVRELSVNISCSEPQSMTLWLRGIEQGKGVRFGQSGVLLLRAKQAQLDGHAVQLSRVTPAGDAPEAARDSLLLRANQGVKVAGDGPSAVGRNWSLQLQVAPYASDAATRSSALEKFDGVVNFELTSTNP
jgi:hypothetical protein